MTSNLWDLNSIDINIIDKNTAKVYYSRIAKQHYYSTREEILVELKLFDLIRGIKITDKIMKKVKSLVAKLEYENKQNTELLKWQEDFKKQHTI